MERLLACNHLVLDRPGAMVWIEGPNRRASQGLIERLCRGCRQGTLDHLDRNGFLNAKRDTRGSTIRLGERLRGWSP